MTAFRRIKTVVLLAALLPLTALAQGWPAQYGGVMLQGFFWNSYYPYAKDGSRRTTDADKTWVVMNWSDANNPKWSFPSSAYTNDMEWQVPITTWKVLKDNVNNISPYIDVMWVPQSGANTAPQEYVAYPGQLNPDCMGFVPVYWFNHGKKDSNGHYYTATWHAPKQDTDSKQYWDLEESAEVKSYFGSEDELRSMIRAYQNAPGGGTKVIMDVILNHKGGIDYWSQGWFGASTDDTEKANFYHSYYKSMSYNYPWEKSNNPDPAYTQDGYDITWSSKDICGDDELFSGPLKKWFTAADKGANDTADKGGWARDLDHTSAHVQYNINRYLDFLLNDLGYDGLRIDYVKGFTGNYMGKFLNEAGPSFSVGECYDGNATTVGDWVRSTKTAGAIQSAAFDFPLKFAINAAFSKRYKDGHMYHKWSYLGNGGMINDWQLKRYAVTFVDNHDTFKNLPHDQHHQSPQNGDGSDGDAYKYVDHGGGSGNGNDRLNFMMEEANVYILCMPGTPCLFYPHFMDDTYGMGVTIRKMIRARRTAGITNMSGLYGYGDCNDDGGGWRVVGDKYELIYQVGTQAAAAVPAGYRELWNNFTKDYVSGANGKEHHDSNKVRVLISSSITEDEFNNITYHGDGSLADQLKVNNLKDNVTYGYAIVDKPSGTYQNSVTVNVRPNRNGVVLVYTTDGSTPTASSRQITQATDLTYTKDVTLKVGVLTGSTVENSTVESRNYYISSSAVSTLHVYLQATTDQLELYAWDSNGTVQDWIRANNSSISKVTIGGREWYDFPINRTNFNFCIRYNDNQSVNIGGVSGVSGVGDYLGVTQDVFLHIKGQTYTDVTASYIAMANDPLVSIDKASGTYDVGTLTVNLNSNNSKYPIVYTTDGTAPTTSSTQATLSKALALGTGSHTIRAGILKDGQVINTVARRYTVNAASNTNIDVFVLVVNPNLADHALVPYIHYWGNTSTATSEPIKMTDIKFMGSKPWFHKTLGAGCTNFLLTLEGEFDKWQTADVTGLTAGNQYYYIYDLSNSTLTATTKSGGNARTVYMGADDMSLINEWDNSVGHPGGNGIHVTALPTCTLSDNSTWRFVSYSASSINFQMKGKKDSTWENYNNTTTITTSSDYFIYYPQNGWVDNWGDWDDYENVTDSKSSLIPNDQWSPETSTVEVDQLPSCATYVPGAHYIYFENDVNGVIAPFAYPYTDNATGGATEFAGSWPGEQLIEPVGTAPNGNPIYRFTIVDDTAPAKLIFNNLGGNDQANPKQSSSYTWVDGGYYSYNGGSQGTVSGSGSAETATEMSMRDIIANGTKNSKYTISNSVTCVKAKQVDGTWYLWVKDTDAEGFNRYEPTSDAMRENALANTKDHTVGKDEKFRNVYHYDLLYKVENGNLVNNFDQSNWMKIKLTGMSINPSDYEGKILEGSTITGTYTDVDNPTLEMNLLTPITGGNAEAYTPNKYTPANFISHDGEYADWFFMRPRVQEYAEIWYAKWDGYKFIMPNEDDAPGELWMKDNKSGVTLETGKTYKLEGFIENKTLGAGAPRRAPSTGGGYSITITAADGGVLTAVDDVKVERQAVGVRYVNLQGAQSAKPFDGINIVVTTYSDGTTSTTKVLY